MVGKHRRLSAFARRTWNFRPLIALAAILVMGFAAIVYAAASELYHSGSGSVAAADEPGSSGPGDPNGGTVIVVTPGTAPSLTQNPGTNEGGHPSTTSIPATVPPTAATTPPAPGAVTGRYAVPSSWNNGFIATVELKNLKSSAQAWTLTMQYPASVVKVTTSWIGGGGDTATLAFSGHMLTVTANNPLKAGATITLGLQFEKTGNDITPTSCQVNQKICSF